MTRCHARGRRAPEHCARRCTTVYACACACACVLARHARVVVVVTDVTRRRASPTDTQDTPKTPKTHPRHTHRVGRRPQSARSFRRLSARVGGPRPTTSGGVVWCIGCVLYVEISHIHGSIAFTRTHDDDDDTTLLVLPPLDRYIVRDTPTRITHDTHDTPRASDPRYSDDPRSADGTRRSRTRQARVVAWRG